MMAKKEHYKAGLEKSKRAVVDLTSQMKQKDRMIRELESKERSYKQTLENLGRKHAKEIEEQKVSHGSVTQKPQLTIS